VIGSSVPRLTRALVGDPRRRPGRGIVHLGVGAFHRAHQAWSTDVADPDGRWGITGFTGRSAAIAEQLAPQDGVSTLLVRGPAGDDAVPVTSLVAVHDGRDAGRLAAAVADPRTRIVTLTVTEAAYSAEPGGIPHRLASALDARRRAGGEPIAVVPCDNLPANGARLRELLREAAERIDPDLDRWIDDRVGVVDTVVDRITPRATDDDIRAVERLCGWHDAAPVVTEPFHEWILAGELPADRPEWEAAGAVVVADAEPYERRKLWMLNGAHTLLALLGGVRGRTTVAEAIADPVCRAAVDTLWGECARHLSLPGSDGLGGYRRALLDRFGNVRIRHELAQIRADTPLKLRIRIVPVLLAEREAGLPGSGAATALAAWLAWRRHTGDALPDEAVAAALAELDPRLGAAPIAELVLARIPKETA
jgi:fructuronate reductase